MNRRQWCSNHWRIHWPSNKASSLEIEKLKHQLKGRQRHRFGSKSESADQLNLELQLEEEETSAARTAPSDLEGEQKPKRKPLPSNLPRNEEVLTPGEHCTCGGKLDARIKPQRVEPDLP